MGLFYGKRVIRLVNLKKLIGLTKFVHYRLDDACIKWIKNGSLKCKSIAQMHEVECERSKSFGPYRWITVT